MRALTLQLPWPFAIFCLGKDVENHGWELPESQQNKRVAIHAGRKEDKTAVPFILDILKPNAKQKHRLLTAIETANIEMRGRIIGTVVFDEVSGSSDISRWAIKRNPRGNNWDCHWHIQDPRLFETYIPCIGGMGFWEIPMRLIVEVEYQLSASLRAAARTEYYV